MTAAVAPTRSPTFSERVLGALAVLGVVVAFSLSSTLIKRAESPGVLVAFWRLVATTIVWNLFLSLDRPAGDDAARAPSARAWRVLRPEPRHLLRQARLTTAWPTRRSSGQWRRSSSCPLAPSSSESAAIPPRLVVRRVVAFGGVAIVLLSAPATGDATVGGNVFGFIAMLLLTGYVVSTRHFRRDMDVAVFMATICPIGALAVLPVAFVADGDVFGLSGRGWSYMLLLTFTLRRRRERAPRTAQRRSRSAPLRSRRCRNQRWRSCGPTCCWVRPCGRGSSSASPSRSVACSRFIVLNQRAERVRLLAIRPAA